MLIGKIDKAFELSAHRPAGDLGKHHRQDREEHYGEHRGAGHWLHEERYSGYFSSIWDMPALIPQQGIEKLPTKNTVSGMINFGVKVPSLYR